MGSVHRRFAVALLMLVSGCRDAPFECVRHDECPCSFCLNGVCVDEGCADASVAGEDGSTPDAGAPDAPDSGLTGLVATPPAIDLGAVAIGRRVTARIRVTNHDPVDVEIVETSVGSPFQITMDECTGSLAPGSACKVELRFDPVALGPVQAILVVRSNSERVDVSVTAEVGETAARLRFVPDQLDFEELPVGGSLQREITLENMGGIVASGLAVRAAGPNATDFQIENCPAAQLNPGESCSVGVSFVPASVGRSKTATLIAQSNAGEIALAQALGAAHGAARLVPLSTLVHYGAFALGQGGGPQLHFENDGDHSTGPITMTLSGPNRAEFSVVETCSGNELPPSQFCSFDVPLMPTSTGSKHAMLELRSANASPVVVLLEADVVPARVPWAIPVLIEFGQRVVSTTGEWLYPEIVLDEGTSLSGSFSYALDGADAAEFRIVPNTCNGGGLCPSGVEFRPTTVGLKQATFTITHQLGDTVIALSGGAVDAASIRFETSRFFEVLSAMSARNYTLTLRNHGTVASNVLATQLAGADDYSILSDGCAGLSLAPNATCQITARLMPSIAEEERHARLSVSAGAQEAFAQLGFIVRARTSSVSVSVRPFGARARVTGPGISCPAKCRASFSGPLTLQAIAEEGSRFVEWQGACSGSGPCVLQDTGGTHNVTAVFAPVPRLLNVEVRPSGGAGGRVTAPGISCSGACSYAFDHGTTVVLEAEPSPGFRFEGWSGGCRGLGATCGFRIIGDQTCVASFAPPNRVFVTGTPVPLSYLRDPDAADRECARLGSEADMPGDYLAWVSTATQSAIARLITVEPEPRGWTRPDGAPFADSISDLFSGRIMYPPLLTDLGTETRPERSPPGASRTATSPSRVSTGRTLKRSISPAIREQVRTDGVSAS
jgi:hypothetical protein